MRFLLPCSSAVLWGAPTQIDCYLDVFEHHPMSAYNYHSTPYRLLRGDRAEDRKSVV